MLRGNLGSWSFSGGWMLALGWSLFVCFILFLQEFPFFHLCLSHVHLWLSLFLRPDVVYRDVLGVFGTFYAILPT
jgi:hypothetical protein